MRKAYATYDPYNYESQYAALRYEDEIRMRASIVIDVQKTVLKELKKDDSELDLQDKERM